MRSCTLNFLMRLEMHHDGVIIRDSVWVVCRHLLGGCGCRPSSSLSNRLLVSDAGSPDETRDQKKITIHGSFLSISFLNIYFIFGATTPSFGPPPRAANPAAARAWSLIKASTPSAPTARANSTLFPSLSVYHYASVLMPPVTSYWNSTFWAPHLNLCELAAPTWVPQVQLCNSRFEGVRFIFYFFCFFCFASFSSRIWWFEGWGDVGNVAFAGRNNYTTRLCSLSLKTLRDIWRSNPNWNPSYSNKATRAEWNNCNIIGLYCFYLFLSMCEIVTWVFCLSDSVQTL